jgi:hypothetical protein
MAKKAKELFIIMGGVTILVAALWFWLYLRPSNARVEDWRERTVERDARLDLTELEANARATNFARMTAHFADLNARWEQAAAALPFYFDDTAVLRHIQSVIYPHVVETEEGDGTIDLTFGLSRQREGDLLYSTIVTLNFTTTYWQFLSILYNLVEREDDMNLGNRVVNYSLTVSELEMTEFRDRLDGLIYLVGPEEDDIPEHIIMQFIHDFQAYFGGRGADVEMQGLYLLNVQMDVEYLSINPGLLSEDDMRALWALEEIIEEIFN